MLKKIKRTDCLAQYPKFPLSDGANDLYFFPKSTNSYILALASRATKTQSKSLAKALSQLMQDMGYPSLIFLGDYPRPWLYQNNKYKPVKEALEYLKSNKINKTFDGGIVVDTDQMIPFTKHLFWLVRCNAALPFFHFMDEGQNLVGSICQYGNVHLSTLNRKTDKQIKIAVEQSAFSFFHGNCSQINTSSSIPSRRIRV